MKKILLVLFAVLSGLAALAQPQYSVGNNAGGNSIPIGGSVWANQRCDLLWLPGEFGAPPVGFITKIYFRAAGSTTSTYTDLQIDIGQSTITSLTTAMWQPNLTTAFQAASHTIAPVSGQWFEIALQTPIFFDPTLALIVNTRQTATTGGIPLKTFTPSSGQRRAYGAYAAANPGAADASVEYDFGFDLIPGFPCTGVPTTALAGPNEICPNKPFSVTFTSFYTGVVRQWQKSTNGTTWSNFTGTINPTTGAITDAISVPSWYRCVITCTASGQTFTTAPKYVGIAPFYYCYCDGSKATGAGGSDIGNMMIQAASNGSVKLDNGVAIPVINNTSSSKTYTDFRYIVPPVPVYRDSNYVFAVSQINSTTFNSAIAAVYVDYNRNGHFDTSERVLLQTTANLLPAPGVVKDTFRIPDTAGIGLTGMRVILRTGTIDPDTCAQYTDGETEDYLLDIRYEPCNGSLNPGIVATTDTSMCPGYYYSIADTTHERKKSDIKWWWQYSPDGNIWANLPNSTNKDTFNNIMFSNTIYYRVKMVCLNTNDTTTTVAQRVGQKAAYKCYCYSLADGNDNNNSIDSSDIGAVGLGDMLLASNGPHTGNELAERSRTDYTDMSPLVLETERRYKLLVYHTMNRFDHADAKVTVFMDFNNNKQYDIPQERLGTWFTSINNHTIVDNIYIPDSAIVNVPTGMRVILNNNVAPNIQSDFACGTYTSGETEDFIVMFKRPIVTGVETLTGVSNLGLYPNPTSGKFHIQFEGALKEFKISIRTVTGQQVERRTYNHRGGLFSEEIDMGSHAKGVYLVELQAEGERMARKLIIQ